MLLEHGVFNGDSLISLTPEKQMSKKYDNYRNQLKDISSGDKIKVKAWCNKLGKKTETLIIP